jgi:oligopeptide transport system ATP-binding protein
MGLSLLFISHDLSMVRFISNRTAVMYLGALMEIGPSDAVYRAPKHPYSQLLIASKPVPDPRLEKARLHTPIKGEIPSPVNIPAGCRFAARCPIAQPECSQKTPLLRELSPGHQVACHLV